MEGGSRVGGHLERWRRLLPPWSFHRWSAPVSLSRFPFLCLLSFPFPPVLSLSSSFLQLFVSVLFFYLFVSPSFPPCLSLSISLFLYFLSLFSPLSYCFESRNNKELPLTLTSTCSLGFSAKKLCRRKLKSKAQSWAELCSGQVTRGYGKGSGQDSQ